MSLPCPAPKLPRVPHTQVVWAGQGWLFMGSTGHSLPPVCLPHGCPAGSSCCNLVALIPPEHELCEESLQKMCAGRTQGMDGGGQVPGHSRLVNSAVVEHKVHGRELLPRLLGLQVQLHHPLVSYKSSMGSIARVTGDCGALLSPQVAEVSGWTQDSCPFLGWKARGSRMTQPPHKDYGWCTGLRRKSVCGAQTRGPGHQIPTLGAKCFPLQFFSPHLCPCLHCCCHPPGSACDTHHCPSVPVTSCHSPWPRVMGATSRAEGERQWMRPSSRMLSDSVKSSKEQLTPAERSGTFQACSTS
jgi:hypothetical protein